MDEHGVKIRYVKPMATTHFMNRKVTMPKKSVSGISQPDDEDVTDLQRRSPQKNRSEQALIVEEDEFEQMANSAIFTGTAGISPRKHDRNLSQGRDENEGAGSSSYR